MYTLSHLDIAGVYQMSSSHSTFLCAFYVQTSELFGVARTRKIFEEAIETLPSKDVRLEFPSNVIANAVFDNANTNSSRNNRNCISWNGGWLVDIFLWA